MKKEDKLIDISIHFYQYLIETSVPNEFIDHAINMFELKKYKFGYGDEINTIANLISIMCSSDLPHGYKDIAVKCLIGAYAKKHQIKKDQVHIDISEVCKDYYVNELDVVNQFNIWIMKPNEVVEVDITNAEMLPSHLKKMIDSCKDNIGSGTIFEFDPLAGSARVLSKKEHDQEHGEGSFDKISGYASRYCE